MSSGKGKDNPAVTAPSGEGDGLLTSEDIFGEMLDAGPKAKAPPARPAPPPPDAARKGPIKVKVSEPRVPDRGPFQTGAPGAAEALPEDVAALLDAFSEPGEAATRGSDLLESLVDEPAAPEPEPAGDSLLDAMMAPDDSLGLLHDLERLGKPPEPQAAPASRLGTRFKAAEAKPAGGDSGALDLGALAESAFAAADFSRPPS